MPKLGTWRDGGCVTEYISSWPTTVLGAYKNNNEMNLWSVKHERLYSPGQSLPDPCLHREKSRASIPPFCQLPARFFWDTARAEGCRAPPLECARPWGRTAMTKTVSRSACVYAVILLISWAHSLTAKGDIGPPYPSNGASVFVPFVNANELSDPSQYVSPQIRVGFNTSQCYLH